MTKLTWVFTLVAVLGWGAFYLVWKRPPPEPQTITQTVDRVQKEIVYKTITKPDGTVIKETKTIQQTIKQEQKIPPPQLTPKWMIGAQVFPTFSDKLDYGGEIGRRIGDLPVWIKAGYNSKRELTLGVSLEF